MEKKNSPKQAEIRDMKGNTVSEEPKKMSYDQLNEVCGQLYQQNQKMARELQQMQAALMSKRMDYLFTVVGNADKFPQTFVEDCIAEIQEALRIPDEEESKEA